MCWISDETHVHGWNHDSQLSGSSGLNRLQYRASEKHTELGDPTKELKALLGQHLVDFKTLLPGQRYRAVTDGTTGSMVNSRQGEVSPDYEKKAKKLDLHVPGVCLVLSIN